MRPGEDSEARFTRLLDELEHHDDWHVRGNAASQLVDFGDARAVEPLLAAIQDPHPEVRASALRALGLVGDAHVVEALIAALDIGNQQTKAYWTNGAAWALGKLRDRRAVEPLIRRLGHPEPSMRLWAANALGELEDAQAVKPLIDRLDDDASYVQAAAARALGQIGDANAVDSLIHCLKSPDRYVRREAARSLGQIRDPRAVIPLIEAVDGDDGDLMCFAAKALGEIGDPRGLEPLIRFFRRPDHSSGRRMWAGGPIGKVGYASKLAFEVLMQGLDNEDPLIRIAAATGLGYLGDTKAVPALERARRHDKGIDYDTGESVKSASRVAIKRIMEFHNQSIESIRPNLP